MSVTADADRVPQICSLHVESNIRYRYAHTVVRSELLNTADIGQEVTFSLTLPETAFVSSFSIEVDGKKYDALVKGKEEAKQEYDQAVKRGRTAAHVAVNPRDSNRFSVSVNVEAQKKIKFTLTYEELLARKLGTYKHFINLEPEQIMEDFNVQINIEESSDITTLTVPAFKKSGYIDVPSSTENSDVNNLATVTRPTPHSATIKFAPTPEQQRELSTNGIKGQLVVLYDVDRSSFPSQILVNDGYFAHFFAPDQLKPLPKYVTFVLDVSGSMSGRKIEQLKQAMESILSELLPQDYFTLLTFQSTVQIWRLVGDGEFSAASIQETDWKNLVIPATLDNVIRAKLAIHKLRASGGTNIYSAFMTATHIAQLRLALQQAKSVVLEPLIIFLTDGQPTVGESGINEIINETTRWNQMGKAAIFSLGLGRDVNFDFLKKLSLRNSGFARKIYEASDTALQLSNFYKEVSSPLLSNITFIYQPEQVEPTTVTRNHFVTFFHGSEIIVCGRVGQHILKKDFSCCVTGNSSDGTRQFEVEETKVEFMQKSGFMERLWGYLTIQQLLEEESKLDGKQAVQKKHQATQLALKFSFVTPVTSLVVVKPEDDQKPDQKAIDVDLSDYDILDDFNDSYSSRAMGYAARQICSNIMPENTKCRRRMRRNCLFTKKTANEPFQVMMKNCIRAPAYDRILLSDFVMRLEEENKYRCTICGNEIVEDSTGNLKRHILTSHPEESKYSMLDFDICHPDDSTVAQQLTKALNNEKVSDIIKRKIEKQHFLDAKYRIQRSLEESTLFLKLNIAMKQSHVFLIISIQPINSQNEIAHTLAIVEIQSGSTSETLTNIVMSTLQNFQINKNCILLFMTECINDNAENFTTKDREQIEKLASTLIEGIQSSGISGGWNPKKIINQSIDDALKSVQPIVMKLGKAVQEMEMPAASDNTEENSGTDWHSTYILLSNLLESKETSNLGITEKEWHEIAQIADVLKRLKDAMEQLERKQHTLGDLYGTWIASAEEIKKIGTTFAETLSTCIYRTATQQYPLFLASLFLDPVHKSLLDDNQVTLAMDEIMKIWQILTSGWCISGLVGSKEMQQILKNYSSSVKEGEHYSALQYWESQKDVQPILYKIASSTSLVPLPKYSSDQLLSNINIILSSLPDDVRQNIVMLRCLKMFGAK